MLLGVKNKETQATTGNSDLLSGIIYLVPFLFLLVARVYSFGSSGTEAPVERTLILLLSYIIAFVNCLYNFQFSASMAIRLLPLLLISTLAFLLMFFSAEPAVALNQAIHMFGLVLVAISAGLWAKGRDEQIMGILFSCLAVAAFFSLSAVSRIPSMGLVPPEWGRTVSRWNGITAGPNLLGEVIFVSIWAGVTWLYLQKRLRTRVMIATVLLLDFVLIMGSDSRTAIAAVAVVLASFWVLSGKAINSERILITRLLLSGFLVGITGLFLFVFGVPDIIRELMPQARTGATDSLSGRSYIWAMGAHAIFERPMGWGFDNLATYWRAGHSYHEHFVHFHNGILDVTAKGGILAGILLICALFRMGLVFFRLRHIYPAFSKALVVFFIANFFFNLAETGYMYETPIWAVLVVFWAYAEAVLIFRADTNSLQQQKQMSITQT